MRVDGIPGYLLKPSLGQRRVRGDLEGVGRDPQRVRDDLPGRMSWYKEKREEEVPGSAPP